MTRRFLALALALVAAAPAPAQLDKPISIRAREQDLSRIIQTICTFADLNVVVGPELKGKTVSLEMKNVEAGRVLSYLGKLHRIGLAVTPDGRTVLAGSREAIAAMNVEDARVVTLGHADAEKMAGLLQKVYQGKVEVLADPRTNSLVLVPTGAP